mmetsp:Transcript_45276/g.117189  ORF Transcript_45276/g.117189 Transcript_45276/m.117189 type:complete len:87 (-) Transcript_45276:1490-1750(-)
MRVDVTACTCICITGRMRASVKVRKNRKKNRENAKKCKKGRGGNYIARGTSTSPSSHFSSAIIDSSSLTITVKGGLSEGDMAEQAE